MLSWQACLLWEFGRKWTTLWRHYTVFFLRVGKHVIQSAPSVWIIIIKIPNNAAEPGREVPSEDESGIHISVWHSDKSDENMMSEELRPLREKMHEENSWYIWQYALLVSEKKTSWQENFVFHKKICPIYWYKILTLIHWPLGDVAVILKEQSLNICYRLSSCEIALRWMP